MANREPTALEICVNNTNGPVETSSTLGRMPVLMKTEETIGTVEGVLVKMTEVGLGCSDGVTTVVDDGTCNKGKRTVGGGDRNDADTDADPIAVGVSD